MRKLIIILLGVIFISTYLESEVIAPTLTGDALITYLIDNYTPSTTLGYNSARDTLYGVIDNHNDSLEGIYSGYTIFMKQGQDPSTWAYNNGIDCEHVWPKSMGAGYEPAKSNMHHLFPCKSSVNSSRSNDPFGESPDYLTDKWYRLDSTNYTIPVSFIGEWAEKDNNNHIFEPRESVKGDIARCMFYFYTLYKQNFLDTTAGTEDTLFFEFQKETLRKWNYSDPPDSAEISRTWEIAAYQDNKPNPYVIDYTLVDRAFFPNSVLNKSKDKTQSNRPYNFILSGNAMFLYTFNDVGHSILTIYSISGIKINVIKMNILTINSTVKYNLSNSRMKFSNGIYFYTLELNGKKEKSGKFVFIK